MKEADSIERSTSSGTVVHSKQREKEQCMHIPYLSMYTHPSTPRFNLHFSSSRLPDAQKCGRLAASVYASASLEVHISRPPAMHEKISRISKQFANQEEVPCPETL